MQILFMWIEKSKNDVVINQNFNFSGSLFFNYDKGNKTLYIREKKDYYKDFFQDNDSIIDLTAIVGTNGSGKSTVLSEILDNSTIINNIKRPRIIIAYADIHSGKTFLASTAEIQNKKEIIEKYNIELIEITNYHDIDYSILFISNSFYGHNVTLSSSAYGKYENYCLSTKSLVNNAHFILDEKFEWNKEKIIFNKYEYFKQLYLGMPTEIFERFETENQIEYVAKSTNIGDMRFAPEEIILSIRAIRDRDIEILKGKAINRTNANKFIDKIYNLRKKYGFLLYKTNAKGSEDFAYKMLYNLLIESQSVLSISFRGMISDDLYISIKKFKDFLEKERAKNILKVEQELAKFGDCTSFCNTEDKSMMFDYYISACDDLLYFASIYFNRYLEHTEYEKHDVAYREFLRLNFTNDIDEIIKIFDILKKPYSFLTKYIRLEWRRISDGEYAFLALFSRIFWFLNSISHNLKDSLILLFDEVDLYLHPEWQRKLIDYIINDIKYIKPNIKIQIIYSTNSPITLSDMPISNVIFMKKDETHCIVDDQKHHKQTFASNIYSLFNDSFYLDKSKGVIGEHAFNCLDRVIKILSKENLLYEDKGYVNKLINIMGDPIIKEKLTSLNNNFKEEK